METQEVAEQISSTSGDQEVVQQLEHVHLGRPRARGQASTSDDRSRSLELEAWDDLEHVWPWLENGDGAGPSEDKGVMEPEQKPSVLTEQVVLEDIGSGTEDAQEESSEQLPGNIQSRPEELLSEEVPKKISSRLEDREVVKQLERVQFNGDIEQSSSEWRQQQHEEDLFQESLDMDHHSGGGLPRDIPFHLLQEITNGFSKERKLGSGAFGEVYMGVQKDGEKIAVKMLHNMPGLDEKQFLNEFDNLSRLQHPNIVRLVGYCHEIQKTFVNHKGRWIFGERIRMALCFEYMHSGSLDEHLSGM
nr:unnamed protein product [Digitaria exilis]